jgi:hypothetical protein
LNRIHLQKFPQTTILLFESASWRIENYILEFRISDLAFNALLKTQSRFWF